MPTDDHFVSCKLDNYHPNRANYYELTRSKASKLRNGAESEVYIGYKLKRKATCPLTIDVHIHEEIKPAVGLLNAVVR